MTPFRGHDRARTIRDGQTAGAGPIAYWMNRDMRLEDNWALLYALDWARAERRPLVVAYNFVPGYLGGRPRHAWFKLAALRELSERARERGVPFAVFAGEDATKELVRAFVRWRVAGWVTDFQPLRHARTWNAVLDRELRVPAVEVDAHNVVPCWVASSKQEFAARTLRPKLARLVQGFLTDIPSFSMGGVPSFSVPHPEWERWARQSGADDEGIAWIRPGPAAARRALDVFLADGLARYDESRNDPTLDGQSDLSPWLHYGNLSPQRVAWEVSRAEASKASKEAFLEELIVRRELADNFCLYQPAYDAVEGFPAWARATLDKHRRDRREHLYGLSVLEHGKTHDDLWNAAQRQMVLTGKMHGFLRMYWAKKLLEWTESPEQALAWGIRLNDAYELDGRDPNGYAGLAWSIGGVHDRPWFERPVFGTVRYMNRAGCERKFDVAAFVRRYGGR